MDLKGRVSHVLILVPISFVSIFSFLVNQYTNNGYSAGQNPGYFDQWFAEKKDEKGNIPANMRRQWALWDKNHLARRNNSNPFDTLWELGPFNTGGRTRAIWVHPSNNNVFLAASISGGMWRSEDAGASWLPLNDHEISMMPSCITHNPFNPDEVYYGTGEARANSADVSGDGIFKSTDGGKNFAQITTGTAYTGFNTIWDIAHSLDNDSTLYVATNAGGLWKSTNKGKTWTRKYTNSPVDRVVTLPNNVVLIGRTYNGPLYSTDGGQNFKAATLNTAVGASFGRIQLSACRQYPNVVYAMFEGRGFSDPCAGFYKSSDSGKTYVRQNTPSSIGSGYQLYCQMLGAHPTDSNLVVAGGVNIAQSNNGGQSWIAKTTGHSDHHAYYPLSNSQYLIGNDGGVYRYSWSSVTPFQLNNGYQVTQFYAGNYAPNDYGSIAGTQDNGTHYQYDELIGKKLYGGDGAYAFVGLQDGTVAYLSTQNDGIRRIDNFNPEDGSGFSQSIADATFETDDVDFINCYAMSQDDQSVLFYRTNAGIYRSTTEGESWTKLNTTSQGWIKAIGIGYGTNPPTYYGGASSQFYMIENSFTAAVGSPVNKRINYPATIASSLIKGIVVDPFDNYTVYLAYSNNSNESRIYKVSDLNTPSPIWTSLGNNLPKGLPVNYVDVDPTAPGKNLFAATDFGLYYTTDSGKIWAKEMRIPSVAIHQVKMRKDGSLFIYTHGRGLWYAKLKVDSKGINTNHKQGIAFTMYPNPAKKQLSINCKTKGDIVIYNTKGQRIKTVSLNTGLQSIDLQNIPKGLYFVKYTSGAIFSTQRLYIEE